MWVAQWMCFSQPVLTELPRPKWMEEPNLCIYRSLMRKCQDNCYVTNLFKPPVRATGYYLSPPCHGWRSAEPKNSPNVQSGAQGWSQQQKAKGTVHSVKVWVEKRLPPPSSAFFCLTIFTHTVFLLLFFKCVRLILTSESSPFVLY